jgi:Bifunctional DNA primase/polymerase, N-terminal
MTPTRISPTLAGAAYDYAERGLYVLPANGKKPLIAGGFKSASNDLEQVRRWWACWPNANIGIACEASGMVVLDVDPRSDGWATLDELEQLCELPDTPCSQTGGDGLHAFFSSPGEKLKGRLPGIDVKHAGYVIAPPSAHPSGQHYEWILDLDQPLAHLPAPWLEVLSRARTNIGTNEVISIDNKSCGRQGETSDEWRVQAEALGGWGEKEANWRSRLPDRFKNYLRKKPSRGWMQGTQTRSQVEASIVYRWVLDGASDAQIIELADAYLPRHIEEKPRRGDDYIERTIDNMRWWAYADAELISSPEGGNPRQREVTYRHTNSDVLEAALALVEGQKHADWIRQLVSGGMSKATAYRNSTRLQKHELISVSDGRVLRTGNP